MQAKMETQVLSIEQMLVLKDLGVDTSKASMCWDMPTAPDFKHKLNQTGVNGGELGKYQIGAFTLQDILDMLPKVFNGIPLIMTLFSDGIYHIGYKGFCGFRNVNPLQSAYQMLLQCITNDFIKKI